MLYNLTGSHNTGNGNSSLYNNKSGSYNTASGEEALYGNTTGWYNTAIGVNALHSNTTAYYNTAVGDYAMNSNTTGGSNTAIGGYALQKNSTGAGNMVSGYSAMYLNTTGSYNVANGYYALQGNMQGNYNTATGSYSLFSNTSGNLNTATGYNCLYSNNTGSLNTAAGDSVLYFNNSGSKNTATGYLAMYSNTTGGWNAATGAYAMYANTTGHSNTGCGAYALDNNETGYNNTGCGYGALSNLGLSNATGNNNTAIGAFADIYAAFVGDINNATAIGYNAVVNASNKIQLGSSTTVLATSGGVTIVSDGRFKEKIKENDVPGLSFINKLRPVTYNFNYKRFDDFLRKGMNKDNKSSGEETEYQDQLETKSKERELGFIAQDVDKIVHDNNYTFSGIYTPQNSSDNYALDYSRFVVPLVKSVQELSKKNDEKDDVINELKTRIEKLEAMMNVNQSMVDNHQSTIVASSFLSQNIPNPFNNSTTINYSLPQLYSSAQIIIYDAKGKALKQINLTNKGKGVISINASTLVSGAYSYSLIIDGKLVDTKQMVLNK